MSRYDGLIIPRSYSEYINKTDAATLQQALQLSGVMDNAPTAQSTKPAKSGGIFAANAVIMASSTTLSGVAISTGSVVRVLFTADIAGSDATTGLTFTYNGDAYAVKVGKNGALANFNAYEVESGVFKYLQAHTTLELMFDGSQFIIMGNPVVISNAKFSIMADGSPTYHDFAANAVIMASSTTLSGVAISTGSVVRVLFTADIAGSDATTGLTFTYNGDAYAVKVGKNGALANFNAYEVESGVFKYLQAHTTLELMFDGSQFIIMGNPVVISNADFSIMADGSLTYHDHISAGKTGFIIIGDILINYGIDTSDGVSFVSLPHSYSNTNYTLIGYNAYDLSPIRGNKFTSGFGTSVSNSTCNYIAIGKI